MTTTDEHMVITRRMLEHAEEFLHAGDLVQASEKGWGVAAAGNRLTTTHYMGAVAKQRGWRNESHRDFFTIENRLARETNNPDRLRLLFTSARSLHQNFYEPLFSADEVKVGISAAKEFIDILEEAAILREPPTDALNGTGRDGIDGNV